MVALSCKKTDLSLTNFFERVFFSLIAEMQAYIQDEPFDEI